MACFTYKQSRIRKLRLPKGYDERKIQIGITADESRKQRLGLKNIGDIVLPSGDFGAACMKNAHGYSYPDKTQPMEYRYITTNWIQPYGNENASSIACDIYKECYSISQNPSAISILSAQKQAIDITADCPYRRTFHSARGWAYQMSAYSFALKENKIFQSMSRKGNCYDNSVMENFFGILKQEMYYGNTYYSFDELKEAIEKYIKYYNEKRIKEKLGWKSPVEDRLSALAA